MNLNINNLDYKKITLPVNSDIENPVLQPGEILITSKKVYIGGYTESNEDVEKGKNILSFSILDKSLDDILDKEVPNILKNVVGKYTYKELQDLRKNKTLVPGKNYILTDYYNIYGQPNGVVKVNEYDYREALNLDGTIIKEDIKEVLMLTAISNNSFSKECRSCNFENDKIIYDIDDDQDGYGHNRPGFIVKRIDEEKNIEAPYDWRNIYWARWELDITPVNEKVYAKKISTSNGTEENINILIDNDSNIIKDELYIYAPDSNNKYLIYAKKNSIFSWPFNSFVENFSGETENFYYVKNLLSSEKKFKFYLKNNDYYEFNVENTRKDHLTFEGFFENVVINNSNNSNNVFINLTNNTLQGLNLGINSRNNTFYCSSLDLFIKNNFQGNTLVNAKNCSIESNCSNNLFIDAEDKNISTGTKKKLILKDFASGQSGTTIIDSDFDEDSINALQNKVITQSISSINTDIEELKTDNNNKEFIIIGGDGISVQRNQTDHKTRVSLDENKLSQMVTNMNVTVDSSLSNSSTNPVQNKVVNSAISDIDTKATTNATEIANLKSHTYTKQEVDNKIETVMENIIINGGNSSSY